MKGESLLEKRKLRRRRGSSGEEEVCKEEALVNRKLQRRRRSSEEEDVPKEVAKPRGRWPVQDFDPYTEFVPDSEPNSDTEDLPNYDDLSDVDPNEIREQNWANEELGQINKPVDFCERGNGGPGRGDLRMKVRWYMFTYYTSGLLGYLD
ncbi:hypothetical protein BJ322DRAFT_1024971 [Thelephora terrestris]|uniref:Uncharacterized protein n=1 Tax=Thelephora terrestris TaxID=56493 RepID=A0A9P6L152_9AGAM|nr:hypothetical protein BJ322DRAFT_1024971 [Thelephora terrestris]